MASVWIERARWLEPIGQAFAVAAFSVQFFYLDPASTDLMRGYFDRQEKHIARIERRLDGTYKPSLLDNFMISPVLDRLPIDIPNEQKRRWRPWLFGLFAFGGLLTVLGKSASVKYATK